MAGGEVNDVPRVVVIIHKLRVRRRETKLKIQTVSILAFFLFPILQAAAFSIGDHVQCTANLNVRSTPSASGSLVTTEASGSQGTISSGPQSGSGYTWWYINWANGYSGWSVQDYLQLVVNSPTVQTLSASSVTSTSVQLNGNVNPNGSTTTVYFQYGLTSSYGNTTGSGNFGSGTTTLGAYSTLSGLSPNTTYHYRIVASNSGGTSYGGDVSFTTSALVPTAQTLAASSITATSAQLNGNINGNGLWGTVYFQYGTTASYGSTTPSGDMGPTAGSGSYTITSLSPNTLYHYRVVASSTAGTTDGNDVTFTTSTLPAPTVSTSPADLVTATSARLNGTFDSHGLVGTIYFQYGTTTSYGSQTPAGDMGGPPGNVSYTLSSLSPNTLYHYRVVGSDGGGTIAGSDATFTTSSLPAPTVSTSPADLVTATSARLNGTFDSHGLVGTIYFQYGTTTSYGSQTPAGDMGGPPGNVSYTVSSLSPNTLYHYRVVGSDSGGTINGNDVTFQTTGQATPTVSAALSTLTATPSSAAADGQSTVTAKVTLRDGNNNPVSGKVVQIHSGGSVTILQPASPTDANGQATATITATAPVTTSIWAVDTADSVVVQQQPTIQFVSAFVVPGQDLSAAITSLYTEAGNDLSPYIGNLAINEGQCGDYFEQQINSGNIQQDTIALDAVIGTLLPLVPGSKNMLAEAAKAVGEDIDLDYLNMNIEQLMGILTGSTTGLSTAGQEIGNQNDVYQQELLQQEQRLLAGVPPTSVNVTADFVNDLQLRSQANQVLKLILINQDNLLMTMKSSSEFNHTDFNGLLFTAVDASAAVVGTMISGPGAIYAAEGVNAVESYYKAQQNEQNLSADKKSYVVSLAPLTLGLGSTTPLGTNGFNLMLQGALGSNYVIEVSTDLFNWTPIMDFTVTNSPLYFTDPAATNSGRQFYRAVMP